MSLIASAHGRIAADSRRTLSGGKDKYKDDVIRITIPVQAAEFLGSPILAVAHGGFGKFASKLLALVCESKNHPVPDWKKQLEEARMDDPATSEAGMQKHLLYAMDEYAKTMGGTKTKSHWVMQAQLLILTEKTTWFVGYRSNIKQPDKRLVVTNTKDRPFAVGYNNQVVAHYMRDHGFEPIQAIHASCVASNGKQESTVGGDIRQVDRSLKMQFLSMPGPDVKDAKSPKRALIEGLQRSEKAYNAAVSKRYGWEPAPKPKPKAAPEKPVEAVTAPSKPAVGTTPAPTKETPPAALQQAPDTKEETKPEESSTSKARDYALDEVTVHADMVRTRAGILLSDGEFFEQKTTPENAEAGEADTKEESLNVVKLSPDEVNLLKEAGVDTTSLEANVTTDGDVVLTQEHLDALVGATIKVTTANAGGMGLTTDTSTSIIQTPSKPEETQDDTRSETDAEA